MKIVAAYLLAVLGGNANPSASDLKKILSSGILSLSLSLLIDDNHFDSYAIACCDST